jgi:hypothetical protein
MRDTWIGLNASKYEVEYSSYDQDSIVESCLDGVFPLGEVDILFPLLSCLERSFTLRTSKHGMVELGET